MSSRPTDIVVTPAVRRSKKGRVSRASYGRMEPGGVWRPTVTADLAAFLAELEMFN
jgi:uncharacterized protein